MPDRSEVEISGIPSGCVDYVDSVPGVSASLQPPATFCDRFAIKMIGPNHPISPTDIVTSVWASSPQGMTRFEKAEVPLTPE